MRGQFRLLPVANPAAAWPRRMGVEEGGKRREGRMSVGAQGRPFQRRSPVRVVRRLGERHEARNVAPTVEHRGLGAERGRRRQGRVRRGGRGRRGPFDRGEGADGRRHGWNVGIRELRVEVGVARSNLLGQGRGAGGGFRSGELSRRGRLAQGRLGGGRRMDGGEQGDGRRRSVVVAFTSGAEPRGKRQSPVSTGVDRSRARRRVDARGGGAGDALAGRRAPGGRRAPFRGERNQAGGAAYGEKKARMENRHRSNPLGRGWTNFADQVLNPGARRLAPFAWGAPGLCVRGRIVAIDG